MKLAGVERLTALVRSCAASGTQRQVMMLRLDRLPAALSRPHHLRLADLALKPLLQASRAELYHMPGPRWAVVWRGDAEDALFTVVEALDRLLDGSAVSLPELAVLYELPEHADLLLEALGSDRSAEAAPERDMGLHPLDPALLTLLEASLAQADVTRFARRRSVWHISQGVPSLAWEERTLSVRELADGLVPGHDLTAEPWLFRRLTRTLDRRMLALLASAGELSSAGPFAVELNAASLVGPEFLRFDANIPPALRGNVVISIAPADVIADSRTFTLASAFARSRSYQLMLRDAAPELLDVLAPLAIEFDYLQLPWTEDLPQRCRRPRSPKQVVLTHCVSHKALAWGREAGIERFSGPIADRVGLGEAAAAA